MNGVDRIIFEVIQIVETELKNLKDYFEINDEKPSAEFLNELQKFRSAFARIVERLKRYKRNIGYSSYV